jgi:hypothetical protein
VSSWKLKLFFPASITASIKVGNGARVLFWADRLVDGRTVGGIAPLVLQAVNTQRKNTTTVAEGLHENNWMKHVNKGGQTVFTGFALV